MKNAKAIELANEIIKMCKSETVTCLKALNEIQSSALPTSNDTIGNYLYERLEKNAQQVEFLTMIIKHWKTLPENTAPDTFDNELETDF